VIGASVLLGYGILVSLATPVLARRLAPGDSPRLSIAVWLACLFSAASSFLLAIAVLALGDFPVRDMLADAVRSCLSVLHHYTNISLLAVFAIGAGWVYLGWLSSAGLRTVRQQRAVTAQHANLLLLTGVPSRTLGATVVDHPTANAYSLPGSSSAVVITTGALRVLNRGEVDAVLAHERAHLTGKHHLVIGVAQFFATAFPFLPATGAARRAVGFQLERLADEAASRVTDRRTLAGALVAVGSSPAPNATLGAGGRDVIERVRSLLDPHQQRRWRRMFGALSVAILLLFPVGLAAAGLAGLAWSDHCLLARTTSAQ